MYGLGRRDALRPTRARAGYSAEIYDAGNGLPTSDAMFLLSASTHLTYRDGLPSSSIRIFAEGPTKNTLRTIKKCDKQTILL